MLLFIGIVEDAECVDEDDDDEYVLEGYIESSNEQDIKLIVNSVEVVINFSNIKSAKIEFKQFKEKVKG